MKQRGMKYRLVFFRTNQGQEVLDDLLKLCHFGETLDPDNPAMVAEHNLGVTILNRCGVFSKGTSLQVLNAFTAVMPDKEPEEE